ncbi:hypothetical protein NL676_006612 [Syzygium grande]|nr:hypothetical protein NL676_006612 [Syzygium grande]
MGRSRGQKESNFPGEKAAILLPPGEPFRPEENGKWKHGWRPRCDGGTGSHGVGGRGALASEEEEEEEEDESIRSNALSFNFDQDINRVHK